MNIRIKCNLKYSLNFKPKLVNSEVANTMTSSKIYCKNLIYFVLFLEYFFKKNQFKHYRLYVQKRVNQLQSVLRAPNKHKKAQVHLKIERYFCIVSFVYEVHLKKFDVSTVYFLVNYLNDSFWFFESSLAYLKSKKFVVYYPIKQLCEL